MTITLQPELLRWARERAGFDEDALAKKVGTTSARVIEWEETGELRLNQAEKVAHSTHTPLGFLFLSEPPEDKLPIQDLRTVGDAPIERPSPDLIETVEMMQLRQSWMRDHLVAEGEEPLGFVGRFKVGTAIDEVARDMREVLGLAAGWAQAIGTWSETLLILRQKIEEAGILIVINGIVGNNTRRALKTSEFRGFALCDEFAPLIFINGTDGKSAQMFTFAHELAHLWIGAEGVSNFEKLISPAVDIEKYCNAVAAEFMIPAAELLALWPSADRNNEPYSWLAKNFKVSPIVAARRALDLGLIKKEAFFSFYDHYTQIEFRQKDARESGGNFWHSQNVRVGVRFGGAVVRATKEGKLLFRDAYRLTGLHGATFDEYAVKLGYRT